jgi:hypothetical protein
MVLVDHVKAVTLALAKVTAVPVVGVTVYERVLPIPLTVRLPTTGASVPTVTDTE